MNAVDIYISGDKLDTFQDEEITLTRSVQNYKGLDKVFTDYTQSFTLPASTNNNKVFSHYYNTSIQGGFDARLRVVGRIEIDSLPFRDGVIELEGVQMKGGEPYAYQCTFYGFLANLSDLFGEDKLYDLDLSAYNHTYDGATILSGFQQEALLSGDVCYPLMSATQNWFYDSTAGATTYANIASQGSTSPVHGVDYDDIKPALKALRILEAIQTKYSITFSGDWITDNQLDKLFLWMHRNEGKLYDSTTAIGEALVNMNRSTGGGTEFDIATDTWTVVDTDLYQVDIDILNATADYELLLMKGSEVIASSLGETNAGTVTHNLYSVPATAGDEIQLKIKPRTPVSFNYQCTNFQSADATTSTLRFQVDQTLAASYTFQLEMSPLAPDIKVADFLAGLVKMHNLVITPVSTTEFKLQTLDDWYDEGATHDFQEYINIEEYTTNRPELYKQISYKYQDTDQILGKAYRDTNAVGFGNLDNEFFFDGEEFAVEVPFECPLFEKLTDQNGSAATNVLTYKSIDTDLNNYLGGAVLFYGEFSVDISANPIYFLDESDTHHTVNEVWWANTSSSQTLATAYALTFGADIDPYHLQSLSKSLYNTYWEDYIVDLYNIARRVVLVDAVLPLGKMLTLKMNDIITWNNTKWKINSVDMNLTTGKCRLELLNEV